MMDREDVNRMAGDQTRHPRTVVAALGLLLIMAAPLAYAALMRDPTVRSTGWPTFLMTAVGALLSLWAVIDDRRRRVVVMSSLSLLLSGLYLWAFFDLARLPESDRFAALHTAPSLELPAQDGHVVKLNELTARGPVLLVFYRGHW